METKPWHILIVEDNADSRQVMGEALRYYRHDVEVRSTNSGRQCLEMLQTFNPILVIVDLALPDLDGWAVLEAMRRDESTAHIPVVATTAYDSASVAQDALRAGFNAYFPKPIDILTFGKTLSKLVEP